MFRHSIVVRECSKMFALKNREPTDKQCVEASHQLWLAHSPLLKLKPSAPEKFTLSVEVFSDMDYIVVLMEGEI